MPGEYEKVDVSLTYLSNLNKSRSTSREKGMITSDHEYLDLAMKSYDNPSCITLDEFMSDLNQYINIKKAVRKYHQDNSTLRKLVNHVVIYYNCFGNSGTDLLMYKTTEPDILSVLIPIILYLGRSNDSLESKNIPLNIDTIKQLSQL